MPVSSLAHTYCGLIRRTELCIGDARDSLPSPSPCLLPNGGEETGEGAHTGNHSMIYAILSMRGVSPTLSALSPLPVCAHATAPVPRRRPFVASPGRRRRPGRGGRAAPDGRVPPAPENRRGLAPP